MGKLKLFFFIVLGLAVFLIFPEKSKAANSDVVLSEVMFYSENASSGEFIELYNRGTETVNLAGWKISDASSSDILQAFSGLDIGQLEGTQIQPKSYALILDPDYVNDYQNLLASFLDPNTILLTVGNSTLGNGLNNDADRVTLKDPSDQVIDEIKWENIGLSWKGFSYERYLDNRWFRSLEKMGTPGFENSVSGLTEPKIPADILPTDGQTFLPAEEISFSWGSEEGVNYELQISKKDDFLSLIDSDDLEIGKYFWRIKISNLIGEIYSPVRTFEIVAPTYSQAISINEICPDPIEGEEWIEFYNGSKDPVDLKGWILEDQGLKQSVIADSFSVAPFGYAVIYYHDSKIILNNDGDLVSLYDPNRKLVTLSPKYLSSKKGWSFARAPDETWHWTSQITPESENIIVTAEPAEESIIGEQDPKIPVNNEPITIQTGQVGSYRDYLARVSGEITRTSGSTFYIDDGSGEVKVYIQEKTGIKKPKMYVGDTFEIFGIINLYRGAYRILPQVQSDIRLIDHPLKPTKTKTTKSSKGSPLSLVNSVKKVAAAGDVKTDGPSKSSSPVWVQIIEGFLAFLIIAFIIFIYRIRIARKNQPIGYDFGNDET